jgi:hypothetical protein
MKALKAIAQTVAHDPTISSSEMKEAIKHLARSIALSSSTRNLVILQAYRVMRILNIAVELRTRDGRGVPSDDDPLPCHPSHGPTQR